MFGAFSCADAESVTSDVDMLELGRFGNANDPNNAQNVVQPFTTQGNQLRLFLPGIAPTVHTMTWLPDLFSFKSSDQFGAGLHQWTYGGQPPPSGSARLNFRLNLWLVAPPSDGNPAEIVISDFSFVPAVGAKAVLRDTSGSIRLTSYASSTLVSSSGAFASDPSVAEDLAARLATCSHGSGIAAWLRERWWRHRSKRDSRLSAGSAVTKTTSSLTSFDELRQEFAGLFRLVAVAALEFLINAVFEVG